VKSQLYARSASRSISQEIADEKSMQLDMEGFEGELENSASERARLEGDEAAVSPLSEVRRTGWNAVLGYQASGRWARDRHPY